MARSLLTRSRTMQLLLRFSMAHACSHLPPLSGLRFTRRIWQARARLPRRFFALLLERFSSAVQQSALDDGRWHGHRTFLVDGSGCSMPDTPALQEAFGQSTEQRLGCGFPVAHLLGLFHAGTGVLLKLVVAPLLTHDLARVQAVHPSLHPGDVLVADRGVPTPLAQRQAVCLPAGWRTTDRGFTPGRPFFRPCAARMRKRRSAIRMAQNDGADKLVAGLKTKNCPRAPRRSWRPARFVVLQRCVQSARLGPDPELTGHDAPRRELPWPTS